MYSLLARDVRRPIEQQEASDVVARTFVRRRDAVFISTGSVKMNVAS
jgi:hypothetical protein